MSSDGPKKLRFKVYDWSDLFGVWYWECKESHKVYRMHKELAEFFKDWEDLQHCDGQVPFVGF